jgi:hypothetical protein
MIQNFFHEYVSHPPIKQNMTKSMATYKISFIAVYICPNARRHSVVSGNGLACIPGWWLDVGLIDRGRSSVSILQNFIRLSNSVEFFRCEVWKLKRQKFL